MGRVTGDNLSVLPMSRRIIDLRRAARTTANVDSVTHATLRIGNIPRDRGVDLYMTCTVASNALLPLAFRALNSAVKPTVRAGFFAPPPIGFGTVLLTTTGRRSGQPREVPVAAFRVGSKVYVSTVRSNSQWMANLENNPAAKIEFGGRARSGAAAVDQLGLLRVATLSIE